jgi:hypothetical protein
MQPHSPSSVKGRHPPDIGGADPRLYTSGRKAVEETCPPPCFLKNRKHYGQGNKTGPASGSGEADDRQLCHLASETQPGGEENYLAHRRRVNRQSRRANYVPRERVRTDARTDRVPAEEFTPLYDPRRDGDPLYASVSAEMFGDPPVGRRAMLATNAPLETYTVDEDDGDVGC